MDPVAFSIFGLDIRWYALLITGGILLGAIIALCESRRVFILFFTQSDAFFRGAQN
jgi:prolipoprotein diacylglyceryltransferase